MAEKVILAEQEYSGFGYDESFGLYVQYVYPAPFVPVIGETYTVVFDGETYTCTTQDGNSLVEGATFIGNAIAWGLSGNNEPFVIGGTSESPMNIFSVNDTEATAHTVAIYQVVEEENGDSGEEIQDGIVLKDRNGNDVAYYGIETVTFDTTTEGKQQTYTKGVAVENLEIVPDFSGGDMPITAAEGTLVKSAVVKKPDGLAAENIRSGAEVAGVVGTFIGDTETVEVDLAMADGDQEITPSAPGKVLNHVVVKRPDTLVPENIAENVEIGGVIGTMKKGADGTHVSYTLNDNGEVIAASLHGFATIPSYLFQNLKYLEAVDISESPNLTVIGEYAFYGCTSLKNFHIPSGVTTIGAYAFSGCTALENITIPGSVIMAGHSQFSNCTGLKSVTIEDGVDKISGSMFNGCSKLESITIPGSVVSVGDYAFQTCTGLLSVTILEGVESIGTEAGGGYPFSRCTSLVSVVIPSSVKFIQWGSFYNCTALTSATFGNTIDWYVTTTKGATSGTSLDLSDAATAATYLVSHSQKWWYCR